MNKHLYVSKSKIHGTGIFSKVSFKKDQIVFILKGKRYKKVNKSLDDTFSNPNWVGIGKNEWIDPEGDYQYINHSCNPNLGVKGKVTFVALKDIKPGDELTFDYSISEADPEWKMQNKEAGKGVRKMIGSIHTLPYNVYKSYLPYIPKYFRNLYERSRNSKREK